MAPDALLAFFSFVGLLAIGFGVGRWRERAHIKSMDVREAANADMVVTNLKMGPNPETVKQALLVTGDAVIATDYFKSFASQLRMIVGGEMHSYDSLLRRARREAKLRLLERARAAGAREIWNLRYETSNIMSAGSRNPAVSVEVFAFATAIIR
jgi:uncharacterized protein YbjQ (UPF0145 family)